jgi:hypothetical protein
MRGFISYAHNDYDMCAEFRKHLKALERAFDLTLWMDERIDPGFYWNDSIEQAVSQSQVFVLLATPDFIASDYIYKHELPAIRRRHQSGALVLPVVLKRCDWRMIVGPLQAAPVSDGKLRPIEDWGRHSDGFDSAREQIGRAIGSYFGVTARAIDWKAPP